MIWAAVLTLAAIASNIDGHKCRGSIAIKNVGLISTFTHTGGVGKDKYSLLCSTYDTWPNSIDEVIFLERPGVYIDSNFSGIKTFTINGTYRWSKEVQQIPKKEFGIEAILIPDGSQINGKQKGKLSIANLSILTSTSTHDISTPLIPNIRISHQYTRAIFKQVSLLGGKDILTCRGSYHTGTYFASELIHLRRPMIGSELTRPWNENILSRDACDGNFVEINFKYSILSRWEALFAINFHLREINILWPETVNGTMGRWDDSLQLKKLRLDRGRRYGDIVAADLNKDGQMELIVSIASEWDGNGSLEIWRIPEDFRLVHNYTKIVVDRGFHPRVTDGISPGVVKVFQPSSNHVGKPWIFLAGADDGRLYYYVPVNQNMNDWRYSKHVLLDVGAGHTVNGFTVVDVDGDGTMEVFVSLHSLHRIDVFSLEI